MKVSLKGILSASSTNAQMTVYLSQELLRDIMNSDKDPVVTYKYHGDKQTRSHSR